jgi:Pyruvate/2-oxoacid:ferredoxin oxidoreductase delta subunit
MASARYDHYRAVGKPAEKLTVKKKRPRVMAVVDEDNCTGCLACLPFCPTDCIVPVPKEKYGLPIPPVQVRFADCIGCQLCFHACAKLSWDAIRMFPVDEFERLFGIAIGADPAFCQPSRPDLRAVNPDA